jgi:hypothetical protein
MVQRIVQLIGGAYSTGGDVHVQGTYNGVEFINGPVITTVVDVLPSPNDQMFYGNIIAQFDTTTDTTGQIPVVLSVTGGILYFGHFWMNYTGSTWVQEPTNPDVPVDPNDPSTYIWVETVPPIDYYADPNTNTVESDGISNLTKNGSPWAWRTDVGDQLGDWEYPINNGDTITFDFFVDPADIVLLGARPA